MTRHPFALVLAVLITAPALPAAAQEEKAVLRVIPPDALGFIVVNRLEDSNNKVLALAKKMQLPLPASPLELLKITVGISDGLNAKGSAAVALFAGPGEDDPPIPVVIVPVSDYQKMLGKLKTRDGGDGLREFTALDKLIQVGKKDNFALFADLKDRELLVKVIANKENVQDWATPLYKWLSEQDVAGMVTAHGWKTLIGRARSAVERGKADVANGPPELAKAMEGLMAQVLGFVKSAETDVTHVAAGLRLDEQTNLHLDARARFAPESGFAKGAPAVKGLEGGPLAGLPDGPLAIAGGGPIPGNAMAELSKLSVDMIKSIARDLPADKARKIEQFYEASYKGMRGIGMLARAGKPTHGLFSQAVVTVHVDNSTAYLDAYEKGLRELMEIVGELGGGVGPIPKMVPRRSKVGGIPVVEITMEIPGQNELAGNIFEKMFGEGGMRMTYAAVDAKTVLMSYTPAAKMEDLLAEYQQKKQRLAARPDIVKATTRLPEGSQWALYVDLKGTLEMVNSWIETLDPNTKAMPVFPVSAVAAAGVRLSSAGLEMHGFVPAQVLEPLVEFVNRVRERIEN